MRAVAGFENERFALVLIDVQKKFSESTAGLRRSTPAIIPVLNEAIEMFRSANRPVVYVKYTGEMHGDDMPPDGDEFADGLIPPSDDDPIVCKDRMNAFTDSDLRKVLNGSGSDSVLLAGLVSQCCVIATYFGAFDVGFSSYILEGGTAATEKANTEAVELICRTLTLEDVKRNTSFGTDGLRSLSDPQRTPI